MRERSPDDQGEGSEEGAWEGREGGGGDMSERQSSALPAKLSAWGLEEFEEEEEEPEVGGEGEGAASDEGVLRNEAERCMLKHETETERETEDKQTETQRHRDNRQTDRHRDTNRQIEDGQTDRQRQRAGERPERRKLRSV